MTSTSFDTSLQLGELGELAVARWLTSKGWMIYRPVVANKPHWFDMLITKEKRYIIAIDVKTKPMMRYYPCQGIDKKCYRQYERFSNATGVQFHIFFVDYDSRDVHSGRIGAQISMDNASYDKGGIVAWDVNELLKLEFKITEGEAKAMRNLSQSNYRTSP